MRELPHGVRHRLLIARLCERAATDVPAWYTDVSNYSILLPSHFRDSVVGRFGAGCNSRFTRRFRLCSDLEGVGFRYQLYWTVGFWRLGVLLSVGG